MGKSPRGDDAVVTYLDETTFHGFTGRRFFNVKSYFHFLYKVMSEATKRFLSPFVIQKAISSSHSSHKQNIQFVIYHTMRLLVA